MLHSIKDLEGFSVGATDGPIGHIKDFYFDDHDWVVRYTIVETGGWFDSRKVLVSPIAISQPDWSQRVSPVSITKQQVKGSMFPGYRSSLDNRSLQRASEVWALSERARGADAHLRSSHSIMKYRVHASDGDLGHVTGLILDDETWAVRYLIVVTSNWWLGHQVLIAPPWIEAVDWSDKKVTLNMTRQAIEGAPPYDSAFPLHRSHEASLHRHHGRTAYWI